jgi:hypothetical protein
MVCINSLMQKVSVFVKVNKKLLAITKTLAQYITEFIMAVKGFMMQGLSVIVIKHFSL